MSLAPATLPWFAAHEFRLAWRDWLAMMTAGRRVRGIVLFSVLALFYLGLHLLANALMAPWIAGGIVPNKSTLVTVTGSGFLFWTVMLSQALESITRAYYSRSDLDLILSSPASSASVFAVRTSATAFATVLLACLLASPIINTLAAHDGPQWLAAYGVLASLGALAAAISVLVTIGLFRTIGPRSYPPRGPDHRRHRRCRLRHRHPGCRHPQLRQHEPLRRAAVARVRRGSS